jgi:hypothetical protein
MEYYSAIKKKEMSFARKWMELEFTMFHKISQVQRHKYHKYVESRPKIMII